ncbi:MAG: Fe-S cluster assembly protein SufD [Pleurocapsa sp.]
MAVQIPFSNLPNLATTEVVADAFATGLLQQCQIPDNEPEWLTEVRQQAATWVSRMSVPTKKDEDWRFIDLSGLTQTDFTLPRAVRAVRELPLLPETENSRLVIINGDYNSELSDLSGLPQGIYVGSLDKLPDNYRVAEYFARQQGTQDIFTALNTAGCNNITVIWVNKNVAVETPIHLLLMTDEEDKASFVQHHILVVAETGASISLIEEYSGTGEYFTNTVSEIYLEDNASLRHTRWQQESEQSFHLGKTAVSQARDSRYTINEINFGAKLSRHNPEILQQGEQTETNLNGLTVATGEQEIDTHSIIALTQPHGTTDQLHKCIVSDRAHTVFNGKVFVPKTAQLTDASQLNRNLLLSSKARVDTKPELQITADNVKCSHGATVSQLEAEEIFYLRSRGLSETDANQLLIDAFAAEIIDRITVQSLKDRITQTVVEKINH